MSEELYHEILRQEGFDLIGRLGYRLHLTIWWNPAPDKLIQLLLVQMGDRALLKADKSYHLKSVTIDGETWARDLPALHDYLEGHFPELRISFSHFRDVPRTLAEAEVRRRVAADAPSESIPTVEEIGNLQRSLQAKRADASGAQRLMTLSHGPSSLLSDYMKQQNRSHEREIEQLQHESDLKQQRLGLVEHLQREYLRKGSAASYCFSISSNLNVVVDRARFQDTLRSIVKDLQDQHRYQVSQKLGGRLNVQVEQVQEPEVAWIEQWLGGALSPAQLSRIGSDIESVRKVMERQMFVTPDTPIVVDGHVRHPEKHVAARIVSGVLHRLDKTDDRGQSGAFDPDRIPSEAMPLRFGNRVDDSGQVLGPAVFPLTQFVHASISGTTGSGKSYFARAIVEEAFSHQELNILVLDPRNQFVGLLVPEDRAQILESYPQFAMKPGDAHGFRFNYFAPSLAEVPSLPNDLSVLASGRSIVSFKGMDDRERCLLAGRIINAAFEAISARESDRPRLLIVVDEAQLFTRRRVDATAKDAAAEAERAFEKFAREARKHGGILTLLSQSMRDFSHELAGIRQMMATKIFFRNSDREIDYASDVIHDGRLLVQLPTGTALVHNASWGILRVRVRPPYSKVQELSESVIRSMFVGSGTNAKTTVSADARRLLEVIEAYAPSIERRLILTQAAELARITSKRKLSELITELEDAGLIRTRTLSARGKPRIIELPHRASDPGREIHRDSSERAHDL